MAFGLESAKRVHREPELYNINHLDAVLTSDGRIVFALAGATNDADGLVITALLDQRSDTLTGLNTLVIPQVAGGLPTAGVTDIDLTAGPAGKVAALIAQPEQGLVGSDANASLLVQILDRATLSGAPVEVTPGAPGDTPNRFGAVLWRADGGFSVLSQNTTVQGNLSDGIFLSRFNAAGQPIGTPVEVVADHVLAKFGSYQMDANPTNLSATMLQSGRIAMTWLEANPLSAPHYGGVSLKMQILRADGSVYRAPFTLDTTVNLRPEIVELNDGNIVVAWSDPGANNSYTIKAQIVGPGGRLKGGVFELSSTESSQEIDLQLVALDTGGFAATWRTQDQSFLARIFDASGAAQGNDFDIVDTSGDFLNGKAGLVAKGDQLVAWIGGNNTEAGLGFTLDTQTWSTLTSWGLALKGDATAERIEGTVRDDRLLGGGGADTLLGSAGNDELRGGYGNDRLVGGTGRDLLAGGAGRDRLTGGGGADSFVFDAASDGGDKITDFNAAEGDRLVIHRAGFNDVSGVLSGATLNTAHAGLFFETSTGLLTYDPDGAGAAARVVVAELLGVTSLAFGDVVFV
ncbi:calcium-binding protein [Gemmobacter nectariphilus]|uniref:calcium-binding protein n=1 Tax=Gemmobacter nectariphilus TaxID=220343 RepID=UPI0004031086|nr:calcium-binding protein [Gemmobacter nectariphilus]